MQRADWDREQTDYWIRQGQSQQKVIALIHGIGAKDPKIYWQKFLSVLKNDKKLKDFDLFIWQYPTHVRHGGIQNFIEMVQRKTLRETAPSIEKLGSAWKTTYESQFQGYHDIILVCHSMGGLIVKSWILDTLEKGESTKLAALRHIAFYATPHQGAPITKHAGLNQQLKDMQLDSPFIEHMDRRWHDHVVTWKDHNPGAADERSNRYIPHLVLAGLQDKVVPSPHNAKIRGMPLSQIPGDHSRVIHPTNSNDTRYKAWWIDLDTTFNMIPPASIVSAIIDQQIPHALSEGTDKKESQPVIPEQGKQSPNTITSSSTDTTQRPVSPAPASPNAVNVFISYVPADEDLLRQLEAHLSTLKITLWSKRIIVPGTDWTQEIDQRIEQASIILFLVSANFLASDYHNQVEVKRAMERQKAGLAHVIPIVVRPAIWKDTVLGHLQPLPKDGKPIISWRPRDEAFLNVAEGIKFVLQPREPETDGPAPKGPPPNPRERKPGSFPPVWNVPYRYPAFFTGRDQMVEQLFERFTPQFLSGPIPAWALTGLGGLGKTQTAVAYAYRHREKYQSVLWANAETESDLTTSFNQMAKLLALPGIDLQQRESVLDGMQKWFTNTPDWLLIVDNADNLDMVRQFLPTFASGHVLLTSRVVATGDGGTAQALELPPLSPDDGALCILRRANDVTWTGQLRDAPSQASVKAAQELCQLMGGLPLALEQAGAYIEITGRGVGGYLELYKKYRPEILQSYYGDVHSYRDAVAFAWTITRESVKLANPAAIELLYLCAFLAPNAIPYNLFPKDARILGPTLGPVAAHPPRLNLEIIALLLKHSLIQKQANRDTDISQISIHRVQQEVLRDTMDQKTQRLWAERAVRVVALALAEVEWSIMQAHAQQCLPLIEQWQMNFREADIIRQRLAAESK